MEKEFKISVDVITASFIGLIALAIFLVFQNFSEISIFVKTLSNKFIKLILNNDGLSSFFGSLLGSVVTILGVFITIKFERKSQERMIKENARPILRLFNSTDAKKHVQGMHKISFYSRMGGENYDMQLPEFVLGNVGHTAINIELFMVFNGYGYPCSSIIDCIPINTYSVIKGEIAIAKRDMESIIERVLERSNVKMEIDKIDRTIYDISLRPSTNSLIGWKEMMEIRYQDVYGNQYSKWYKYIIIPFEENGIYKFYLEFDRNVGRR